MAPPLTKLLSVLPNPVAIVSPGGVIDWANIAFRNLFLKDQVPASLEEWEVRSPPGEGTLLQTLENRGQITRRLSVKNGVKAIEMVFVSENEGSGILICSQEAGIKARPEERTTLLETIFHFMNDGVLALDADEKIVAMSASAERITGFAEVEVLGRTCNDVFQAPPGYECPFQIMIREKSGFRQREMQIRGKGGRPIHVSVNANIIEGKDKAIDGAVIILRDLTELDRLKEGLGKNDHIQGIIGVHKSVAALVEKIETVAPSDVSVVILGESGTGKELVAKALHFASSRKEGPFIKVNCGALSENLLESEIFGHVRGAFTGAVKDKPGRFELADGGTLFLDEVGDMPLSLQVKLLRVLQEGEFERVGGTNTLTSDVRIIAATNKDLRSEIAEGRFREDLFYRLCVVPINIPPLRERVDDIPILADHFLKKLAYREGRRKVLTRSIYAILKKYSWPGNVRELENALSHAYVCSAGDVISAEALPEHIMKGGGLLWDNDPSNRQIQEIYEALEACGWNKGEAANRLGMSRTTFWRRMRALGISDSAKN